MDARLPNADDVAHKVPKRREQRDKQVPGLRLRIGKRQRTWVLICRMHGRIYENCIPNESHTRGGNGLKVGLKRNCTTYVNTETGRCALPKKKSTNSKL